jgi:predicted XRE-type DNA-binding protein
VFYVAKFQEAIYVLHAFAKKTQETSQKDIVRGKERYKALLRYQQGENMSKTKFVKSSGNIFKDVGFDEIETKSLKFRSHLMTMLMRYIQHEGLTQKKAAQRLGVSQPRVSNLVQGKIDLFSAGMLLDMMERAGFPIYRKIEADAHQFFRKYEAHHSAARHA